MWMLVHLTQLVLSSATFSNEIVCGSFLIKNPVICVPTTLAKQILFHNPMNKKLVGGKHHVLIHYVEVCVPNLSDVLFSNPFIWDNLWFILVKNPVICVPSTLAKQILFHNHRNKNLVGGKHHVLIHYADTAPNQKRVFLWNHLNERFLGAFCLKIWLFLCIPQQQSQVYSSTAGTKKW